MSTPTTTRQSQEDTRGRPSERSAFLRDGDVFASAGVFEHVPGTRRLRSQYSRNTRKPSDVVGSTHGSCDSVVDKGKYTIPQQKPVQEAEDHVSFSPATLFQTSSFNLRSPIKHNRHLSVFSVQGVGACSEASLPRRSRSRSIIYRYIHCSQLLVP